MVKPVSRWITTKEAAAILECSIRSTKHFLATGQIKARRAHLHRRIERESVLELAKEINQLIPAKGA
jgi:hypothetical protein